MIGKRIFKSFIGEDAKIIKCGSLNPISDYLLGSTTLGIEVTQKWYKTRHSLPLARRNYSPAEGTSNSGYQRLQGKGESLGVSGQQQSRMLYAKWKSIVVDKAVLQENKYYLEEKLDLTFHN